MAEQRQQRRHPESILRVTFEPAAGGQRASAAAWDASLGGMFLETDVVLDEGALVTLELKTADATVSVDSRVLWARPQSLGDDQPAGMAVRFIDLPDDVSVALSRALQSGMHDRTILGVGGVSKEPTQIGIAAPEAPKPVSRETQIGVAPPASDAVAPPNPVIVGAAAKPHIVVSDTSLPETPVTAPVQMKTPDPSRLEETAPSRARFSAAEVGDDRYSRKPKGGGVLGRVVLLGLLGAGAAGVYMNRGKIAELLAPPAPAPTTSFAPSPTSPAPTASAEPSVDAATPESGVVSLPADAATAADAAAEKAQARDAGVTDAGVRDGGRHDAGVRDAGHDGGAKKAKPKHPPATAPDDAHDVY